MRVLSGLFVGLLVGGSLQVTADILYSVTELDALASGAQRAGYAINNAGGFLHVVLLECRRE